LWRGEASGRSGYMCRKCFYAYEKYLKIKKNWFQRLARLLRHLFLVLLLCALLHLNLQLYISGYHPILFFLLPQRDHHLCNLLLLPSSPNLPM
jgi:hypothetical protein